LQTITKPKLNPLVVVDATNHKISHFEPFYRAAVSQGYCTYVATIDGEHLFFTYLFFVLFEVCLVEM
jgi:hypothetical protein